LDPSSLAEGDRTVSAPASLTTSQEDLGDTLNPDLSDVSQTSQTHTAGNGSLESVDDSSLHYPSQGSHTSTQTGVGLQSRPVAASPSPPPGAGSTEEDLLLTLRAMQPSLQHLPEPTDTERQKQYVPRNPYRTPSCFPSVPAPIFDDPAIFERFSTDSLFFIFYFQQGTQHQYLAARELKKQSWRYHKNFLTWFQRHDEPKLTTEEYERGTYLFFDYESGWCHAIKTDFTFEYRHLEDELINSIGQ
jgi:CCR4-NOT transcription complex subunit 3